MDLQVTDNQAQSRFEIRADGELAGFVQYEAGEKEIAFTHTETDDRFRGHGLAGRLVQSALEAARDWNLEVLPYCPFVRSWITGHREYTDLVPADRRSQFDL
jgi:predicted GNAT family acetyltransferase